VSTSNTTENRPIRAILLFVLRYENCDDLQVTLDTRAESQGHLKLSNLVGFSEISGSDSEVFSLFGQTGRTKIDPIVNKRSIIVSGCCIRIGLPFFAFLMSI